MGWWNRKPSTMAHYFHDILRAFPDLDAPPVSEPVGENNLTATAICRVVS
jgi:hypothetical protein